MTWVIEVDVDDIATGPLHGELLEIVDTAINTYKPGYAQSVRIRWRDEDSTLGTTIDILSDRLIERAHGRYSEHHNAFFGLEADPETRAETLVLIAQADAAAAQRDTACLQGLLARRAHTADSSTKD